MCIFTQTFQQILHEQRPHVLISKFAAKFSNMCLILGLLLLMVSSFDTAPSNLQPYPVTALALFISSDTNGDGVLQRDELVFAIYDTNGDDRISRYEYTSFIDSHNPQLHAYSHALYDIYDVDSDDHLDSHDLDNFHKLMDGNSDGFVSRDEYVRAQDMDAFRADVIYWTIILETLEHLHSPSG